METVFITIHDLSRDARIKYCSDSIEDILGYLPNEVIGKACWEYFHPDEIPFAREIHDRGIELDKASVMNYARIKHKSGEWIGCECVFTVVHDVLVASTAIYRRGPRAQQRALDGAGVRRIFSSSPRDPRYHMLSFLSNKFSEEPTTPLPEPRAALFLNRFTRTSTIMYATSGVSTILGLDPEQIIGKSFYYCVQENCLRDAVKCLESAKANDSIAYLRFWYRNPLQPESRTHSEALPDNESDEDEGGVPLVGSERSGSTTSMADATTPRPTPATVDHQGTGSSSVQQLAPVVDNGVHRTISNNSTNTGSVGPVVSDDLNSDRRGSSQTPAEDLQTGPLEIEAVISCTSDGLVVVLRKASPLAPHTLELAEAPHFANGVFASPWAPEPVMPDSVVGAQDLTTTSFMTAIKEVAVFAWSLTGINGSLAQYARGHASGEALPPDGLPVWDPDAEVDEHYNAEYNGFLASAHRPFQSHGSLGVSRKEEDSTSSEDEVVWKRAPILPPWRRPKRRAHHDAFGGDVHDGVDGGTEDGGRKRHARSQDGSGTGSGSGSGSATGTGSGAGSATGSV
ncbi:hypothetical protein PV08_00140 [Exophiala spinifera]|uniref:PAS domain-containing protein n=1 Tax=Exophiala spinifera TaxID=91928 RepID=A0A0D2A3Z4_9EURO|nr:uncharacterized protein PV08_00140 [Exophiala spinifera]KIW19567.1 hypothetical protein PV08_00140 [Exophiala spinifera]